MLASYKETGLTPELGANIMIRNTTIIALLTSLACLPLSACSKKVPECNSMVEVVNPAVDKLNGIDMENEDDAKKVAGTLDQARAAAEEASTKLGALEITIEELKKFREDYKSALDTVATEAKAASTGVADMGKMEAEVEAMQKTLETATGRLEVQCAKDTATCLKVGAVFASPPEDAGAMRTAAGSLSALKSSDPELQKTIEEIAGTFTKLADITSSAEKFVEKMDGSMKRIDAAIDKQNKTVDALDAFCRAE